jgi:hypothetical protein
MKRRKSRELMVAADGCSRRRRNEFQSGQPFDLGGSCRPSDEKKVERVLSWTVRDRKNMWI